MIDVRLAPLAGVSDWPFRQLCFIQGCDCAYTEMISAQGFVFAGKQQAIRNLLIKSGYDKKLIVQMFGKDPRIMSEAAEKLCEMQLFDGIDINMGCPVHKVAANGEGAGLMKTPQLAKEIMKEVVRHSSLPVSVKMRLGWDESSVNCTEIAVLAEQAGVKEITVHGRTRKQMYSGSADWMEIGRVKKIVSIPVIGNGDIVDINSAFSGIRESGVDGIMIGRGAMGNPWIFRQIKAALEGSEYAAPSNTERLQLIRAHYKMMLDWKGEKVAVSEMRKHLSWYLHGMRNAALMRQRINHIEKAEDMLAELDRYFSEID